jgi:hypothetical protein
MPSVQYNPRKLWNSVRKNTGKNYKTEKSFKLFGLNLHFFSNPFSSKKAINKTNNNQNNNQSRNLYPGQKNLNSIKVFAPKSIPEKIIDKVIPQKKKKWQFGFKTPSSLKVSAIQDYFQSVQKEFNLWLVKIQLIPRLNFLVGVGSAIVLLFFFFYLCFFDTYFIVNEYEIKFTEGSYISSNDTVKIIQNIKDSKLLGIVPNNQYWFLNSQNLTSAMSKFEPEIVEVKVQDRVWPNKAILEITTQPILITLGINNGEYWRISQTGKVLSSDEAGLREKLVNVERPISLNRSGVTLQNYSFQDDLPQLNRFWFINWIWKVLELQNYKVLSTTLPSLFDTDIIITLDSGTKLYFDSNSLPQDSQKKRIDTILDSKYRTDINLGEIKYLDFRIPRKVFICLQNRECSNI